ncbi:hypothetical protein, conserved [Leishmania tarentolae]|uniref:Uncharacterized protein n=1 Tax=Leishmania tarentolae TaxID=5689 RepID=A0A640K9A3_LEITA|nr:hypothetical protein, conserved [Leishmania tarentolae]
MGNTASSSPVRASSSSPGREPQARKMLVNVAPRASAGDFRSPAAIKAASLNRQARSQSPEAKSASLQQAALRRRQHISGTNGIGSASAPIVHAHVVDEDGLLQAFTRNSDPISLRVLELIQQADAVPQDSPSEKLHLLQQCYPLLERVPNVRFEQLAVTVYQKEGDTYYQQGDMENAKSVYSRAITLAEKRVARQDIDMYMVLKRYVMAMVGLARIWYGHERDHRGFTFVDHKHPKVQAVDGGDASHDANSSMSSFENSLISDGGSVFSLNEAILKSMAPHPPRRQTGPLFQRVKMQAPHVAQSSQSNREEEFVLHSRMTRELVASPCELLLLRCCEVVQIGHNSQSELLIPAQIELAQIYEDLALYSRALLLVRRCVGILCTVFDYDHPWVIHLMHRADRLEGRLEEQMHDNMATKIQATWKMYRAMRQLEDTLGRAVRRHQRIPRKYRTTPDLYFLQEYVGDMPADELLGDSVYGGPEGEDADPPHPTGAPYVHQEHIPPSNAAALVHYAPNEHAERGDTFTMAVPNATVVGTTQDTQTDTDVHHTEYGDVLTVRTTTVTKTITEDLVDSGDDTDEESSEEEEQPCDAIQPTHPPLPAPPTYSSEDDADEYGEERECTPTKLQQQQPSPQAPPPPMRREKQTQAEPCGQVVTAQPRRPPSRVHEQAGDAWPMRHEEEEEPPRTSRQAATASPQPQRHEVATQCYPGKDACRMAPPQSPPQAPMQERLPLSKSEKPQPNLHNLRDNGNGFDDELSRPPPQQPLQQQYKQPAPLEHCSSAASEMPSNHGRNDEERFAPPLDSYEEGNVPYQEDARSEVIAGSDAHPRSWAPSQTYVPDVCHNSRREMLRDLVDPSNACPTDSHGLSAFLPPLGHRRNSRRSSWSSSVPQTCSESGRLVPHAAGLNSICAPRQQKMPMYPTPTAAEYSLAPPQAGQPPLTVKTTRDYKIIKTRRVRTYTREPVSGTKGSENSTNTSTSSSESMSSARWEADSSSVSGSTHVEYLEEKEKQVDAASVNSKSSDVSSPRQKRLQPSRNASACNEKVPHRPHKPRMPTPPTKPLAKATGNSSGAAAFRPSSLPAKAQAPSAGSEEGDTEEMTNHSNGVTTVKRRVKSGPHGTESRTTRRFSTSSSL